MTVHVPPPERIVVDITVMNRLSLTLPPKLLAFIVIGFLIPGSLILWAAALRGSP